MYKAFYNLKEIPFGPTPDPSYLYLTAQHREALGGLVYSCCTRTGLAVLVGEAGTGKSTLLYALRDLLQKRACVTALLNNPTLTREEFYDLLGAQLGVECSSPLKSRRLMALEETLRQRRSSGQSSVLIVDEAQRLSTELLEEIRLLLNIETTREKLLQVIIAGQPELADILGQPNLRQFKQRVSCMCKLEPLNAEDLRSYVRHRLKHAGLPAEIQLFTEETFSAILDCTRGIPRLVNSVCDGALRTGFAMSSSTITREIVLEAAEDLELAPAPIAQANTLRVAVNGHAAAPATGVHHPVVQPTARPHANPVAATLELPSRAEEEPLRMFRGYAEPRKSPGLLRGFIGRWRF